MFLVVTNKRDLTSDLIVLELKRRELPFMRLNTEDFASSLIYCSPAHESAWSINIGGATFGTSDIHAAYFRRPEPISIPSSVATDGQPYCMQEWHSALESLYWELGTRWLNAPYHIMLAENKLRQLRLAIQCGMKIPETLATNDPQAAVAFCEERQVIGKPFRQALVSLDGVENVIFTNRIHIDATTDPQAIKAAPMILQQEIRKLFDIRVTVVGESVFTAAIDSQSDPETQVDWRRSSKTDLKHLVHELPAPLSAQCVQLTKMLGLRFGAIDFVLDTHGEYWFLEINPNGQWGWIESRTELPIANAIVNELVHIGQERQK
jgi:hypothetical protein